MLARLDRSASAKEIAQTGAAVGREFFYELLSVVSALPQDKLDEALDQLIRSELLFSRGEKPHTVYTFKHALVRDAAYAGLLKTKRTQLHAAIAHAFEQHFPELVEAQPETLAWHLTEAGLVKRGAEYWLRAGRNAASTSANIEATAHLQRGIEAARRLPNGLDKDRLELDLQLALAPCLIATQGPASTFGDGDVQSGARAVRAARRSSRIPSRDVLACDRSGHPRRIGSRQRDGRRSDRPRRRTQ